MTSPLKGVKAQPCGIVGCTNTTRRPRLPTRPFQLHPIHGASADYPAGTGLCRTHSFFSLVWMDVPAKVERAIGAARDELVELAALRLSPGMRTLEDAMPEIQAERAISWSSTDPRTFDSAAALEAHGQVPTVAQVLRSLLAEVDALLGETASAPAS